MSEDSDIESDGSLTPEALNAIRIRTLTAKARQEVAAGKKPEYVNGRKVALMALDHLMGRRTNIQKLYAAMQERFDVDPLGFMQQFAMPLTPKTAMEDQSDQEAEIARARVLIQMPDNGRGNNAPG